MLEGCASIGYDKATVDWALVDTTLRFVSNPPLLCKKHSFYYYQAIAASLVDEHPVYSLIYGPSWLKIDWKGKLTGFVGTQTGDQTVIIRAIDSKGNYDFQTFNIHIADSVLAVASLPMTIVRLQCFPNPITENAHFIFTLEEKAHAQIEIVDMKGIHIRSLLSKGDRKSTRLNSSHSS